MAVDEDIRASVRANIRVDGGDLMTKLDKARLLLVHGAARWKFGNAVGQLLAAGILIGMVAITAAWALFAVGVVVRAWRWLSGVL